MKKRIIAMILAAFVLAGIFGINVYADGPAYDYIEVDANSLETTECGVLIAYRFNAGNDYCLIDADGNQISKTYSYIYEYSSSGIFKVESSEDDTIFNEGVIDMYGNELIPPKYAAVEVISDRWQAGINVTPCDPDDKDYTFTIYGSRETTKEYYRIDTVDFYYRGEYAGSLTRSEYGDGYSQAYGAFLRVRNKEGNYVFYNSKMERSPRDPEYSSEFDSVYRNGSTTYYHNGTGQVAFNSDFSVPIEDIDDPYEYSKGVLYDVYGNVVFTAAQNYDSIGRFYNGYAVARMNSKEGLVNLQGEEIVPLIYDDVTNYEDDILKYGCVSVVKDGKFGFVDANGNETCDFVYSNDIVKNRSSFASIQNLDGTTIVITGLGGELAEHFADVSMEYDGSYVFIGKNDLGQLTLIDVCGNTLLPYSDEYWSMGFTDGTVVTVKVDSYTWRIYRFDFSDLGSVQPAAAPAADNTVPEEGGETAEPAAEGSDADALSALLAQLSALEGGENTDANVPEEPEVTTEAPADAPEEWTCSNGHAGNTGKFCSECGEAKPAAPEVLTACPECGYEFPEGATPKFCPECGFKLSQE